MFRFNNPDAVMVLLMMAGAYCTVRALQRAGARWMALAGVALGFAFLAKMLEGLMVIPALGGVFHRGADTAAPRLLHLSGLVAFAVSAGWFVVLTLLWPASSRPYIAGSADNNFMNLVLGYNGFARVLGRNQFDFDAGTGSFGHRTGNGHGGFCNQTRAYRGCSPASSAFEIGWLLPAALLAIMLVVIARGRAPRTDLVSAAVIVFGGWLVVDGLVLSFMQGISAPAVLQHDDGPGHGGACLRSVSEMWRHRATRLGPIRSCRDDPDYRDVELGGVRP